MRNLKTVNYDEMFTLSAPSPKWVWNAQGQLVEIPAGQPAFGYDRFTGEPLGQIIESVDATNVLLNSFAPATQTVSVSDATTYTLSVYGSGSAEITAGGSGTATDGSPLTFTTTGTSVTVTVTGALDAFQLETGPVATSPIETTGSAVTRAADALDVGTIAGGVDQGAILVRCQLTEGAPVLSFDGTALVTAPDAETHTYVISYDSTETLISIDGADATAGAGITPSLPLNVFRDSSSAGNGYIEDLVFSPIKKTAAQVKAASAAGEL